MITLNDDDGPGRTQDDFLECARDSLADERKLIGIPPAVLLYVGLTPNRRLPS